MAGKRVTKVKGWVDRDAFRDWDAVPYIDVLNPAAYTTAVLKSDIPVLVADARYWKLARKPRRGERKTKRGN